MIEKDAYAILKELLQVTSPFIRERFLEHCVEALARLLQADFVFISRALDVPTSQVRVLAAWENGQEKEGWNFQLAGTPCDLVYDASRAPLVGAHLLDKGHILISNEVRGKFPATLGTHYEGFVGVPIWNRQAEMIGHIAVFFNRSLDDPATAARILDLVQVMAHRVEAELERMLLEEEMVQANEALMRANAQLLKDSVTDSLTQVSNRRYFHQRCKEAFARFQRFGEPYSLLLFDVDHFKSVNDHYGHDAGDQVLKHVAATMSHNLRADVEVLARLGGEEFAVICHGVSNLGDAALLAERIRSEIAASPLNDRGHSIGVTVSAGVAGPGSHDASWEDAYRRADRALYASKNQGRNQVSQQSG